MDNFCLDLFNERVDRLDRCKLAKRMDENPQYTFNYEQMIKRQWISVGDITEDDIDAFVLNVRLLIQDNDGFSIRCLARRVYSRNDVPNELKDEFSEHRRRWRDYMERSSAFKHDQDDRNFRNDELFDILLYGGLAHCNRDKVVSFHALTKQGALSSIVFGRFLSSLRVLIGVVRDIREVNKKVLKQYNASNSIDQTG